MAMECILLEPYLLGEVEVELLEWRTYEPEKLERRVREIEVFLEQNLEER